MQYHPDRESKQLLDYTATIKIRIKKYVMNNLPQIILRLQVSKELPLKLNHRLFLVRKIVEAVCYNLSWGELEQKLKVKYNPLCVLLIWVETLLPEKFKENNFFKLIFRLQLRNSLEIIPMYVESFPMDAMYGIQQGVEYCAVSSIT